MSRRHNVCRDELARPYDPAWTRFADSEYLRGVLIRIEATPNGWRTDPEADDLVRYVGHRFAQLAIKHGFSPDDAMTAGFDALCSPAVRYGFDPWGVVVAAVTTTFRAWQFAEEALTSIETARRGNLAGCRAERFSEREVPVWERDPNFAVGLYTTPEPVDGPPIHKQAEVLAKLFVGHGWPAEQVIPAIEIVLRKLADAGSRPTTYEALRRQRHWRALTGLPASSWTGLLRVLLGTTRGRDLTDQSQGVLLRLALGDTLTHLMDDPMLNLMIAAASPNRKETCCG